MNTLDLARLQFAVTTGVHWLFVILTLGLVPLIAIMHTQAARTRDHDRLRMSRFWGRLYVINYALGIVTGMVMEFQFGLSWSGLSKVTGNVFGAPLALETLIAFFAESTFLGMWIFGWGKLRPWLHVTLIWLVALTAYASAYWVLVTNGFMQAPVGYVMRDGVAYLTDFAAIMTNPSALVALGHIVMAAMLTGGLFVAGVAAYHLLRGREEFRASMRTGVLLAALATFPVYLMGGLQYPLIAQTQPMKMAVISGGAGVPELQKAMVAAHGPGDYVPPDWMLRGQYLMLGLGYLLGVIALAAFLITFRERLMRRKLAAALAVLLVAFPAGEFTGAFLFNEAGPYRGALYVAWVAAMAAIMLAGDRLARPLRHLLTVVIPLPFLASVGGWVSREVGRQPWVVYGELTTGQALSAGVSQATMLASLLSFAAVLGALAVANWTLIIRTARRGLEPAQPGVPAEPLPTF
ncbi:MULTISPECIES: cytochrome ubiquinol oxidase subunit I [unclassified Nonomuraea]|uniref:cytochrome ubiquinol oxidase subunit I n=1 Tax=unclassified Nonomuraea TaxID=2593643 RepID=UPI0033D331C2